MGRHTDNSQGLKRIRTFEELAAMADERRSIVWHPWKKPKPASFVMHMTGAVILKMLESGIYLYHKKEEGNERFDDTRKHHFDGCRGKSVFQRTTV